MTASFAIVIPTRNRPEKLRRCLASIDGARRNIEQRVRIYVADSSDADLRATVRGVVEAFDDTVYGGHDGQNVAAARNACVRMVDEPVTWLLDVDDDIVLAPDCLAHLAPRLDREAPTCVIAGSVAWGDVYSRPVHMRLIGYGRQFSPDDEDVTVHFLVGAMFAYPLAVARRLPWNERIRTADDIFMGALWRAHSIALKFAPDVRATHDPEHNSYDHTHQDSHLYAVLFDAWIANPSLARAVTYPILEPLVTLRGAYRAEGWSGVRQALRSIARGFAGIYRDRRYLRELTRTASRTSVSIVHS